MTFTRHSLSTLPHTTRHTHTHTGLHRIMGSRVNHAATTNYTFMTACWCNFTKFEANAWRSCIIRSMRFSAEKQDTKFYLYYACEMHIITELNYLRITSRHTDMHAHTSVHTCTYNVKFCSDYVFLGSASHFQPNYCKCSAGQMFMSVIIAVINYCNYHLIV